MSSNNIASSYEPNCPHTWGTNGRVGDWDNQIKSDTYEAEVMKHNRTQHSNFLDKSPKTTAHTMAPLPSCTFGHVLLELGLVDLFLGSFPATVASYCPFCMVTIHICISQQNQNASVPAQPCSGCEELTFQIVIPTRTRDNKSPSIRA